MKKIGIVDIIIVFLVIALCVAGYFIISEKEGTSTVNISDIEFTVEVRMLRKESVENFKVGDEVYDILKGGYYGEIVDVKVQKSNVITSNSVDGTYILEEYPDRYDAYITIKGTPTSMTEEDIMFASQKIKVGTMSYLKNNDAVATGYIVDVNILDKEAE